MNFWGVQVKGGEPCKVQLKNGKQSAIHISQVCLEELKRGNGNESFPLYVKTDDKKVVIGTLSPQKWPQISLSLVFDSDFELFHDWKHGIVHFTGYIVPLCDHSDDAKSDSELEEVPVVTDYVKLESQDAERKSIAEKAKTAKSISRKNVKVEEPKKDVKLDEKTDDSSDEEEGSSSDNEDKDSDDQDMLPSDEDEEDGQSDDDDDVESNEDELTPKKAEPSKKRSAEPAKKTPVPDKKLKFVTPQKTDGPKKMDGHTATPYPSKKLSKMLANSDQKAKSFTCNSCKRSFGSENALQSHSKAKHGAA